MNKPLKYGLLGLGGLVVLGLAGAAVFALTFDPNRYKDQIERLVSEQTGRKLELKGDIKLAFWPSLGADVAGLTLSERASRGESPGEFLSLESAHGSVALMPLLRGQAIVDGIRVSGLKANIVKHKDGRYNFSDLLEAKPDAKEAKAPKEEPKDAKGAVGFDIAGIQIERSAVSYRDEASGQELAVSDLKLATGRIAERADGKLELKATVKGKNPDLDAKIDVGSGYRFDLPAKAFSLSKLDARLTGAAAGITGLDLKAKGDVAANPEKNEYRMKDFSLDLRGVSGKQNLEARIAAPELVIAADKARGAALTADLKMKDAAREIEAKLKLSGVEGSAKALVVPQLTADVTMTGPDLPQKTVKIPVNGSLRADLEKQTANADLAAKFDESSIQAKLGLAKFSPPAYLFDINIDRLNLDKYFPPAPEGAAAKSGAPAAPSKAETPVDFSALKGLDANGQLQVGSFQVQRVKLANLKAKLRAAGGRLDVSPHSAELYGGSVSGALSLEANANRVSLKETLSGVSIGPLLRDLAQKDLLEGRGNVSLDIVAAGASVEQMKKSLAGSARTQLRDGAIKGINLAEKVRKAKALFGAEAAQGQSAVDKTQKTDFSELSASFAIKNGVAHNEDLDVKSPLFRIGGSGDIDIGNSRLDYVTKAAVVATTKGQGGEDLERLRGLTVPVRLSGPFDDLKYDVDYRAMAGAAAKSQVGDKIKERVEERKERVEERLGDRLKGLLKR